jgi:excisionase family DNA binding protein
MQPSGELLLVTAEAAEILGVDPATVVRWAEKGKLKPVRKLPGRSGDYLFSRDDVIRRKTQNDLLREADERDG